MQNHPDSIFPGEKCKKSGSAGLGFDADGECVDFGGEGRFSVGARHGDVDVLGGGGRGGEADGQRGEEGGAEGGRLAVDPLPVRPPRLHRQIKRLFSFCVHAQTLRTLLQVRAGRRVVHSLRSLKKNQIPINFGYISKLLNWVKIIFLDKNSSNCKKFKL